MSNSGKMDKIWWIQITVECYSAIRKTEILQFVKTWMDLKDNVIIEMNQRKTNIVWSYRQNEIPVLIDTKNSLVAVRGGSGGKVEGDQKVQTSSYKSWDVMVATLHNIVLHI